MTGNPGEGSLRLTLMRRTLLLIALSTSWLLASVATAHASCLAPPPIEQALDEAGVVFVGTVVDFGIDGRQAVVEVESVWKGEGVATVVSVVGGGADPNAVTSVDRFFEPGVRYIFFPTTGEVPFVDNACTLTQPMTDEIEALAPGSAQPPIEGETITFEVVGGGVPGVAPPPGDGFGSDEEPAVVVPGTVVVDGPGIDEREPVTLSTSSDVDGLADSYLLPMIVVAAAVALAIGGAAAIRRIRKSPIE